MRVILNADDFGMDADTLACTVECFDRGALSSASIMPHMPETPGALAFARANPQFSFGVHLTFVGNGVERPLTEASKVSALVAANGSFITSDRARLLALRNAIPVNQIETEMFAQLAFVRDHGVPISHVDSHSHLHKFKPFVEALKNVLPRFGISRVRSAQDTYIHRPILSPTYWLGANWRRRLRREFATTEHFFMPTGIADAIAMGRWIPSGRGTIEIGVHPGHQEPWRSAERAGLESLHRRILDRGHQIITWRDIASR